MTFRLHSLSLVGVAVVTAACGTSDARHAPPASTERTPGAIVTVDDTTLEATLDAAGVAEPIAEATLATKLMGTVLAVLVREGDQVEAGQPLVRIDASDLAARQSQVQAAIAEAEAVHRDAVVQAGRIRALYADSAATRVQLDAAETGLARAEAAVRQARAGASELEAVTDYSVIRAPFRGVVTRRFVDPGAFAAPGAPLVGVQDSRRLRVTAKVAPDAVRALRRGDSLGATIEGLPASAIVEGVVPAPVGNVYTVNAVVENASARWLAGSAATLRLPLGSRRALLIPASAVRREGDLTGVVVRGAKTDDLRWVRLGSEANGRVEVLGGLRAGDRIVVPDSGTPSARVVGASRGS